MLEVGNKAPAFTLPTSPLTNNGKTEISLKDLKGSNVIIYFYPKDLTSGCTKQSITFSEHLEDFAKKDTIIIGISPDSVTSHDKFIQKRNLQIILAADEQRKAIESYGVWKEKKMYGRSYMGVERSTFLVDRNGSIKAIWRKVRVNGHIEMLLETLDQDKD